jgi:hypothetical protein
VNGFSWVHVGLFSGAHFWEMQVPIWQALGALRLGVELGRVNVHGEKAPTLIAMGLSRIHAALDACHGSEKLLNLAVTDAHLLQHILEVSLEGISHVFLNSGVFEVRIEGAKSGITISTRVKKPSLLLTDNRVSGQPLTKISCLC